MKTSTHHATALLLGVCLAACTRTDDAATQQATAPLAPLTATAPTAPPTPPPAALQEHQDRDAWMRAVFGQAYDANAGHALIEASGGAAEHYVMTLKAAQRLPDGRIALVVNGMESDEHGNTDEMIYSDAAGILNVYILQPAEGGWAVIERHDDREALGKRGEIGEVAWISLGTDNTGFTVTSTDGNRGQWFTTSMVYELGHDVRELALLRSGSDIRSACVTEHEACWEIEGTLRTDTPATADGYADILIDFHGKRFRVTEGANGEQVEHLIEPVKQTARYRFDGKSYVLASGANPAEDSLDE